MYVFWSFDKITKPKIHDIWTADGGLLATFFLWHRIELDRGPDHWIHGSVQRFIAYGLRIADCQPFFFHQAQKGLNQRLAHWINSLVQRFMSYGLRIADCQPFFFHLAQKGLDPRLAHWIHGPSQISMAYEPWRKNRWIGSIHLNSAPIRDPSHSKATTEYLSKLFASQTQSLFW